MKQVQVNNKFLPTNMTEGLADMVSRYINRLATYLNYQYSEESLNLLSQAAFKDGLVAQLPNNIKIAHKFGEHVVGQNGVANTIELHDCGIVYYPDHPYLICVMTKGTDITALAQLISNISLAAYQQIQEKYK